MKSPRLSETTTGRTMLLTSKVTEDLATLELLVLTQDGGKCLDSLTDNLLPTKEERLLKCQVDLTMKTKTLL